MRVLYLCEAYKGFDWSITYQPRKGFGGKSGGKSALDVARRKKRLAAVATSMSRGLMKPRDRYVSGIHGLSADDARALTAGRLSVAKKAIRMLWKRRHHLETMRHYRRPRDPKMRTMRLRKVTDWVAKQRDTSPEQVLHTVTTVRRPEDVLRFATMTRHKQARAFRVLWRRRHQLGG
jgi:hypothetical protein